MSFDKYNISGLPTRGAFSRSEGYIVFALDPCLEVILLGGWDFVKVGDMWLDACVSKAALHSLIEEMFTQAFLCLTFWAGLHANGACRGTSSSRVNQHARCGAIGATHGPSWRLVVIEAGGVINLCFFILVARVIIVL